MYGRERTSPSPSFPGFGSDWLIAIHFAAEIAYDSLSSCRMIQVYARGTTAIFRM
jgi:hypothetical protein